jgi:hypothetical protein
MATPRRLLALADLVEALEGISTEDGYKTTVATVARVYKTWDDVQGAARPFIGVLPVGNPVTYEPMRHIRQVANVNLYCHVSGATPEARAAALENLLDDIVRAIGEDHTRGGNAIDTRIVEYVTDEGDPDAPGGGSMEVRLEIPFIRSADGTIDPPEPPPPPGPVTADGDFRSVAWLSSGRFVFVGDSIASILGEDVTEIEQAGLNVVIRAINPALIAAGDNRTVIGSSDGVSWSPLSDVVSANITCMARNTSTGVLMAGTDDGRIFRSEDIGQSWAQQIVHGVEGAAFAGMACDPDAEGFAPGLWTAVTDDGLVVSGYEAGTSWGVISDWLGPMVGVHHVGSQTLIALASGAIVLRDTTEVATYPSPVRGIARVGSTYYVLAGSVVYSGEALGSTSPLFETTQVNTRALAAMSVEAESPVLVGIASEDGGVGACLKDLSL